MRDESSRDAHKRRVHIAAGRAHAQGPHTEEALVTQCIFMVGWNKKEALRGATRLGGTPPKDRKHVTHSSASGQWWSSALVNLGGGRAQFRTKVLTRDPGERNILGHPPGRHLPIEVLS